MPPSAPVVSAQPAKYQPMTTQRAAKIAFRVLRQAANTLAADAANAEREPDNNLAQRAAAQAAQLREAADIMLAISRTIPTSGTNAQQ